MVVDFFIKNCKINISSFKTWGCIGIRQELFQAKNGNHGVALSPVTSVQRNLSAEDKLTGLYAKVASKLNVGSPALAPVAVAV